VESQLIDCEQTYQSAAVGTIAQYTDVDIIAALVHREDICMLGKLSVLTHRGWSVNTDMR
jgi:hypothetical protein